jgi:hypothetical protein
MDRRRTRRVGPDPWPPARRRTIAVVAALLIVVLIVAGLVYFLHRWPRGKAPPRVVPPAGPTVGYEAVGGAAGAAPEFLRTAR